MSEEQSRPIRKMNTFTALQNLKLGNFVMNEFEKARMSSPAFAAYASDKLGFQVNDDHIRNRVKEFGLKFTTGSVTNKEDAGKIAELERKVTELGDRIADLEDAVKVIKLAAKHNVRG